MERTGYYYDEMGRITNGTAYVGGLWADWTTDLDEYSDALAEIDAQMAENQAILDETEAAWEAQADAMNDTTETTITWQEAASTAFQAVEEDVTALIEAYSDAYDACYTSLTGQFGLFDEASMKSDEYMNSTVANAQAALDSQLAYWETYSANIDTLKSMSAEDLGVTQENYDLLMSYVQDGSEEAAGLAASMVQNIQNGNTEAVTELATTAGEVQAKQEEIAASVADWTTGFSEQMDEIVSTMENTIDDMNLDTEANEAATATIQAYADAILANKSSAVSAAQQVSAAVAAALKSGNTSGTNTSTGVAAHASGTTDAEDVFVAGENGPELVVGAAGSTVFPTDQTRRIINAVDNASDKATNIYLPGASYEENDTGSDSSDSNEKRVFLEIAGKGNIELTGGKVDDETLLAFLYEYLKPVLAEIVTQEIFEEGDSSYEY
jgi:hypothetical protein